MTPALYRSTVISSGAAWSYGTECVGGAVEALSREISRQKRLVPLERGISPLCFAAVEMTIEAGRSMVISEETG